MTTQTTRPARQARPALALTALLMVALVLLLSGPVSNAAAANKAWTVMVYLDGDNNLEDYVTLDIRDELSALGSNADVNVVCIADRIPGYNTTYGDWTTTKLYYCTQGMLPDTASAVADWGERNMGDPQTLADFVTWTKTNYPADHYMIAFWDHGYMWFPEYWNTLDDTSADSLDDDEQVDAMAAAGGVDVVAWDQCQRQLIEVAANWQPYAKAMAGSEDYTNWEGIQYDLVIAALRATPTMTAQQCSDTVASTAQGDSLSQSSLALDSRFDTLMTAVDEWAVALRNGLPANASAYDTAWRKTVKITDPSEKDLYDAAYQIKAAVDDPNIDAKCDAVMTAVGNAVTVNWTDGSAGTARDHGLAIWWPNTSARLGGYAAHHWTYYRTEMSFSSRTAWDSFIGASCLADYVAPTTTDNTDGLPHRFFALVLTPSDASSGVFYTEYRIDGGDWQTGTSAVMRVRIRHKVPGYSRGSHLVEYRSIDNACNVEATKSCTLRLGR